MSVKLTGESMQSSSNSYTYGFFKLKNNHDKAIVRFLHEDYDDFSRRPVHFVKVPTQKYSVSINCLRADNEPESNCPFCNPNIPTEKVSKRSKRIYIEFLVYQILDKNNKVIEDFMKAPKRMVWERDRRYDDKIFSLSSRCNPLHKTVFQVERLGDAGSTDTSYEIYPIAVDESLFPYQLPEKLYDPDGVQVEDKSADEMNYYLENDYKFPPKDDEGEVTRRSDVVPASQRASVSYAQPAYQNPVPMPTAAPAPESFGRREAPQGVGYANPTPEAAPAQEAPSSPVSRRRSI